MRIRETMTVMSAPFIIRPYCTDLMI
jgi:hypothetical protein